MVALMERSPLGDSLHAKDWAYVANYFRSRHELDLPESIVAAICKKSEKFGGDWSDATWDLWLRKRIDEIRAWPRVGCEPMLDAETAILHVFFLALEETNEMLENLRKEKITIASSVARSKISKTAEVIQPIDRVAMRVM